MNTECLRISEQLRRAFEGGAWHGPSVKELLTGISVEQAQARPVNGAHSIWELTLHITTWAQAALDAVKGAPMPQPMPEERNWPVPAGGADAWRHAVQSLMECNRKFSNAVENFGDERLGEIVRGRKYDFYTLMHGVVQHSLYHAGQIAVLRKAMES